MTAVKSLTPEKKHVLLCHNPQTIAKLLLVISVAAQIFVSNCLRLNFDDNTMIFLLLFNLISLKKSFLVFPNPRCDWVSFNYRTIGKYWSFKITEFEWISALKLNISYRYLSMFDNSTSPIRSLSRLRSQVIVSQSRKAFAYSHLKTYWIIFFLNQQELSFLSMPACQCGNLMTKLHFFMTQLMIFCAFEVLFVFLEQMGQCLWPTLAHQRTYLEFVLSKIYVLSSCSVLSLLL